MNGPQRNLKPGTKSRNISHISCMYLKFVAVRFKLWLKLFVYAFQDQSHMFVCFVDRNSFSFSSVSFVHSSSPSLWQKLQAIPHSILVNHFLLNEVCTLFIRGSIYLYLEVHITPHFKWKKLSNNSSWDFEYVLDTVDDYWVGPDKNFCPESTPTRWRCYHFSKKWSKSKFDATLSIRKTFRYP